MNPKQQYQKQQHLAQHHSATRKWNPTLDGLFSLLKQAEPQPKTEHRTIEFPYNGHTANEQAALAALLKSARWAWNNGKIKELNWFVGFWAARKNYATLMRRMPNIKRYVRNHGGRVETK